MQRVYTLSASESMEAFQIWNKDIGYRYYYVPDYLNHFQEIENGGPISMKCSQMAYSDRYINIQNEAVIFSNVFDDPITFPLNSCMDVFYKLYYLIKDRQ